MAQKKQDQPKNFRVTDEFECWIGKQVLDLNCTFSEFVTACIILGSPLIRQNPSVLKTVTFEELPMS